MYSSAYTQGSSHVKCDDFASHCDNGVVVCDGCSGSRYGDVASRFVGYTMIKSMEYLIIPTVDVDMIKILLRIITNSVSPHIYFSGDNCAGDTTLLVLTHDKPAKVVRIVMLGDGYVYIKYKDGGFMFVSVSYTENYPLYISYLMDPKKMKDYGNIKQFRVVKKVVKSGDDVDSQVLTHTEALPHDIIPGSYLLDVDDIEYAAVFSDGLGTFRLPEGMELYELAEELTTFKVMTSGFAERTMNMVLRKYGKPEDDFSIGVWVNDNR